MTEVSGITLILVIVISFCVAVLGSLSRSAQATFSLMKLEEMLATEQAKKRLEKFLVRRGQIFLGITVLSTLAIVLFLLGFILFFARDGKISIQDVLYSILLGYFPLLIFIKAIPEALGRLQPERIMLWLVPISPLIYWPLAWIIMPIHWLTARCEKLMGESTYISSPEAIEKEILKVVQAGEKQGILQTSETDMIAGIIDLKDREVSEIMTPRIDMFCLPMHTTIQQAIPLIIKEGYSRIPIYKDTRDDIVGIFYVKDLLKYWENEKRNDLKLADLMYKPYFVPETKTIGKLLKDFQKQKVHMAVILDEYGGTAGIVTVEDIIEEIVGDIADEYEPEMVEPVRYVGENIVEVDARVHVEEVNEALQVYIPVDGGYDTIGGFLFTSMGRVPKQDEKYYYQNVEFIVLNASERQIRRIKVIKHGEEKTPGENT